MSSLGVSRLWPKIAAKYLNSGKTSAVVEWHDGGLVCPSTAYECSQSPSICLEWIWEPFHVGLGPQPIHHDIICSQAGNREFPRDFLKFLPTSVVRGCHDSGLVCPSTAYECSQIPCICFEWIWEPIHVGPGPHQCTMTSFVARLRPENLSNFLNSGSTCVVIVAWWVTGLPIHRCSQTPCIYWSGYGMGTIPCGSGASNQCTMTSFSAKLRP